jgi:hypothetical protein
VADDEPQTKTAISFSKSLFVCYNINHIIMNKMGKNKNKNKEKERE